MDAASVEPGPRVPAMGPRDILRRALAASWGPVLFVTAAALVGVALTLSIACLAHVSRTSGAVSRHMTCADGTCTMSPGAVLRLRSADGLTRVDMRAATAGMQIDVRGTDAASTAVIGGDGSLRTVDASTGRAVLSIDPECVAQSGMCAGSVTAVLPHTS